MLRNHLQVLFLGTWIYMLCAHARADITVIVHPDSPVSSIDADTVARLFMKKTGEVNGVALTPLDLHKDTDVRRDFYQLVAHRTPDYMLSYWTRLVFTGRGSPPAYVSSEDEMLFQVSRQKNLIGYVDSSKVSDKVKPILVVRQQ